MEQRVPHDQLNLAGAPVNNILDDGIERPAGLAGQIEELDDPDLGLRRAIGRRMRASSPKRPARSE